MNIFSLESVIIDNIDRLEESIVQLDNIQKNYKDFLFAVSQNENISKLSGYRLIHSDISDKIRESQEETQRSYDDIIFYKVIIDKFKYLNDHVLCASGVTDIFYDLFYVRFTYNKKNFGFYMNERFANAISGMPFENNNVNMNVRIDYDPGYLTPEQALEELPFMSFHLDLLR